MLPDKFTASDTELKTAVLEKEDSARRLYAEFDRKRNELIERTDGHVGADDYRRIQALSDDYKRAGKEAQAVREQWTRELERRAGTANVERGNGWPDGLGDEFLKRLGASKAGFKALDGTSGGTMVQPFVDPRINVLPVRRLFVRSVIPAVTATGDKVWSLRQSVATNAAAEVAPGSLKPTSTYTVERIETRVSTIAHIREPLDRSLLSDYEELVSFIDGQLRLGVLLRRKSRKS
jgi:HK97 family phage major capsid protein